MSAPEWCSAGSQWHGGAGIACGSASDGQMCTTFVNQTDEVLDITGGTAGVSQCLTVAVGASVATSSGSPAFWTVTGDSTGTQYLLNQEVVVAQTITFVKGFTATSYTEHREVPWPEATIGTVAAAAFVWGWGEWKDKRARRWFCEHNPGACQMLEDRNPQTGRVQLRGYPPGMKRNARALPLLILCVLAALLAVGWAASQGAFGYSTLTWTQCTGRATGGWVWTALQQTPVGNAITRWTGLGVCANPQWEQRCYETAQMQNNSDIAWNVAAANTLSASTWQCACQTSDGTQTYECTGFSSGAPCVACSQ